MAACTLLLVQLTGCSVDDAFRLVERVRPITYIDWGMWDALHRLAQQLQPLVYALPAVVTLEEWRRE